MSLVPENSNEALNSTAKRRKPDRLGEAGNALLEFALVLPIIIVIFVGTVEFTRLFRFKEMMNLVSRGAAHETFRECFDTRRSLCKGTTSRVDACLSERTIGIAELLSKRLPGATLTVTMYVWDEDAGTAELVGSTLRYDGQGGFVPTRTEFNTPEMRAPLGTIAEAQEVAVVGEVYYRHPFWFDLDNIPSFDIELYDVTVF